MNQLTDQQLKVMPHEQLFKLFRHVRSFYDSTLSYAGPRCCEVCHEYIGDDWYNDVVVPAEPYRQYLKRIEAVLRLRPFVRFNKKAKLARHREMLADLKGGRRPRDRHHRKPAISLV